MGSESGVAVRRPLPSVGALALAAAVLLPGAPLGAQEPDTLPPDSVARDSLRVDSLALDSLGLDSLALAGDTLDVDSLDAVPDSLVFHELPALPGDRPAGWETGVWLWNREDLLSTRALSLEELLAGIPGLVPLRGGDFGTPRSASAFGLGGGGMRVFLDGFEILPLAGGVPDLARIGLGGIEEVRVERGPLQLRVELTSYRVDDPRPLSLVEAGTGELDTNRLNGLFIHPRVAGGSFGFVLERTDSRGRGATEPGSQGGTWFRYTLHRGDGAGLRFELRQTTAETSVEEYAERGARRDWVVRARARIARGLVAEAFTGSSSVEEGPEEGFLPVDRSRRQHGLRAGWEMGPVWLRGSARLLAGVDLPSSSLELEGGGRLEGIGSVAGRITRESWDGVGVTQRSVEGWTDPILGLSAFAGWSDGQVASRIIRPAEEPPEEPEDPPEDPEDPPEPEDPLPVLRLADRSGLRLGLRGRLGPLDLSGAWLRMEADSLLPLGIQLDRDQGVVTPGGTFTGWEGRVGLRLPVQGFTLRGQLQSWDQGARYLPPLTYSGGLHYHDTPMEGSDNLEIWASAEVHGRDPMLVPFPQEGGTGLQAVPFGQSWDFFLQIRIVTVRIFLRLDNFTGRENLADLPERLLHTGRSVYGIRWTLWN
jgi:hypothetical protein